MLLRGFVSALDGSMCCAPFLANLAPEDIRLCGIGFQVVASLELPRWCSRVFLKVMHLHSNLGATRTYDNIRRMPPACLVESQFPENTPAASPQMQSLSVPSRLRCGWEEIRISSIL